MRNKQTGKIILMIFSALIIFLFSMCEDFEDETLKPGDTDAYAITAFEDSNEVTLDLGYMEESGDTLNLTVSDTTFEELSGYSEVISHLEDSSFTIEPGNYLYNLTIKKAQENVVLLTLDVDNTIIVYTTHFVDVNVVDADKNTMDVDRTIDLELLSGLYTYEELEDDYPQIVVKSRSEFELSAGTYMLKISATESTSETSFSVVVVEEQ